MSKIVFIGPSQVYGLSYGGVTTPDTFVYKIGIASGYASADILNKGLNSDTMNGILNRMMTDVVAYSPAVVVLMVGTNDLAQISSATFKTYLQQFVDRMVQYNIKTVFITPPLDRTLSVAQTATFQEFLRAMADVAAINKIICIPAWHEFAAAYMYLSLAAFNALYASDGVHQTPAGQDLIAQTATRPCYAGVFTVAAKTDLQKVQDLSVANADYLLNGQDPLRLPAIATARAALP